MDRPPPLTAGRAHCLRCGGQYLNPLTLRCLCSAEFTPDGLAYWRTLPLSQALRTS